MQDDFLTFLNYQIKEEVINGYLRERRIIEEEKQEFSEKLASYKKIEAAAGTLRDYLACLLITPENFQRFFSLIGFQSPPLSWIEPGEMTRRPPACPVGLSPKGFTARGRYLDLIIRIYEELGQTVRQGREVLAKLKALADEINRDIRTFHQRYDILDIINFLKSMDVEMLVKKKFLGGNFNPDELDEIHNTMTFKPIKLETAHSWPELPSPREVKKNTAFFVYSVFRQNKETIRPALY